MNTDVRTTAFSSMPDEDGHFGVFGGRFVSETLVSALSELEEFYKKFSSEEKFIEQLD